MADGQGTDFKISGSTSGFSSTRFLLLLLLYGLLFFEIIIMIITLQVLLASISAVVSNPVVYDQRQSGKTNVRVELKDAVIIAISDYELGGDYDYHYDYSDLTIKPSSSTSPSASSATTDTPKSTTSEITTAISTSTTNVNITQNAALVLEAENNSIIFPASNAKPGSIKPTTPSKPIKPDTYKPDQIPVVVLQEVHRPNKFLPVKTVEKHYIPMQNQFQKASNASIISAKELPVRRCSPGFFLDDLNRCKKIRRPTRERPQLPIGLRFDFLPSYRS